MIAETATLRNITLHGAEPKIGLGTDEGLVVYRIKKGVHDDTIGEFLNRGVRVAGQRTVSPDGERQLWADDIELVETLDPASGEERHTENG